MTSFYTYLIEKEEVSPEDLLRCIDYRRWLLPFLGSLAVKKGYLRAIDVIRVVQESEFSGRLFGEVAVSKGLLTNEQLRELIMEQRQTMKPLAHCLDALGILPLSRVEKLELEFETVYGQTPSRDLSKAPF